MAPSEDNTIPVTVIIPVKNEATALPNCLKQLSKMAAVVVVDSGSQDGTVEIAQQWGAHILQFKWSGGFPKKRNWTLQNYEFSTDWVLFLDADEVLTPDFIREIRGAVASTHCVGFWIKYANFFQGQLLRFGVAQRKLALFRVGSGYYEQIEDPGWSDLDMEVHEHPILEGPVGELHSQIRHEDYSNLFKFIERHNKYSTWEARRYLAQVGETKRRVTDGTLRQRVKYALVESPWLSVLYFLYTYIFLGGILDGRAGLHYAIFKAIYFFDISQKIQELKRSGVGPQSHQTTSPMDDQEQVRENGSSASL